MSTFIGQLVGFTVIVWIMMRYVAPPVRPSGWHQTDAGGVKRLHEAPSPEYQFVNIVGEKCPPGPG
jgi:hypothetical protein